MAFKDKNKIVTSFYKYPLSHTGPFVYYKSLLEKSAYGAQLNYNAADKFLYGNSNFITTKSKRGLERITQALNILKNSADAEAAKEQAFLESLSNKINNIGIPENELPNITEDPFGFMAILNEYIIGTEQYKQELLQEKTRIQNYRNAIKKYKNSKGIYQAISEGKLESGFLHNLSNTMEGLTNKGGAKSSSFTAYNASIRSGTMMSKIAEGVIYRLISKYGDSLIDVNAGEIKLNGKQANALVTAITNEIQRRWRTINKGGKDALNMIEADKIMQQIKDDESLYEDIFEKYMSMDNLVLESLTSYANAYTNNEKYEKLLKQPRKNRQTRDNLRQRTKSGLDALRKRSGQPNKYGAAYEKLLRKFSEDMAAAALSVKPKVYFQSEANLMQLISENTEIIQSGGTTKDDVGIIHFDLEQTGLSPKDSNELKTSLAKIQSEAIKQNKYKEGTAKEFLDNAENAIKALQEIEDEIDQKAQELGMDSEEIKKLSNIFVIHGNVKSYDTIGVGRTEAFEGGSIGANITEQLTNLTTLMSMSNYGAGYTGYDTNWLLSAIINSGPNLIGESNKEGIEKYLGSMLGYLLFDDAYLMINGGANVLSQQLSGTTVQKVHIYNLNGTYVPCSFVLQATYDNLMGHYFQKLVGLGSNSFGIRAKVHARGADGGPFTAPEDWEAEKQAAINAAKIEIEFMGDFLGLLDNIGNALSNPG